MGLITPLLFLTAWFHPIHASVSEINFNPKNKALQITSRIFIDDLELSIRSKLHEPELDLISPGKERTTDQLVSDYLKDHFKIRLDGKQVLVKLLGHETEDATLVCYIEVENVKKLKVIEVFNDLITETHSDQSNLVHVEIGTDIKSARLTRDNPSETFKFESK
jgi:hypothetical protein